MVAQIKYESITQQIHIITNYFMAYLQFNETEIAIFVDKRSLTVSNKLLGKDF